MGMIDQIIDFNKTSGTTRMEEYVPTLSRDCHDVPLLAKKKTPPQSDVFFWVPGRTRTFLPKFQEISKRFKLLNTNSLGRIRTCRHIS